MKCLIIYFILLYIFIVYNFQVTEQKLKEIFSEKGIVTDVQLKYTPDGKFRRFGFVGYQTEEEASAAVNYFNNTCINTTQISVDFCLGLGKQNFDRRKCTIINFVNLIA